MTTPKKTMKVEVQGGINWTWFKVQNGKLVAVFRLHHDTEPLIAFQELRKGMTPVNKINVPWATWREKCDLVANHYNKKDGYDLPEVIKAFGWLNDLFRGVASDFEKGACPEGTMRHLEYHGITICRIRGGKQ